MNDDTQEYLARIRKTVADARAMVDAVKLRVAETDRLLAKQGLTREQVQAMRFTPEQEALVDEELRRRGMPPLMTDEELAELADQVELSRSAVLDEDGDSGENAVENRRRKFGSMMQDFRL